MFRAGLRIALALLVAAAQGSSAQTRVTSPEQQFGHPIGADYVLPDYTAFSAYWEKLSRESNRMVLDTIGTTAEGRAQLMAIITAPANHARLDHYRDIARRLALAEGITEDEARRLAQEGRAVVWIDGGLHATEVLGAQQLMETVYQLLSRDDAETRRILDDIIILAVHANPDGMELVSDWYMRRSEPTERSTSGIPRLYQKYVGHDNNRDFYASVQPETENMNRVMYTVWYPQIVYNHHQTGPAGTVMFAPPFRDPFNHNYDPLIPISIDMVGSAMHDRFLREDKPGVTMRSGATYSTWWNGGLRTTPYFHNMIGLLTETIGNPTPLEIPFIPRRQAPHGDLPAPIEPQTWHFRQSVDYSVTANYAVLDLASRRRDVLLYNIWKMGQNSIERGSRDTWTHYPRYVLRAAEQLDAQNGGADDEGPSLNARGSREEFQRLLRDPALRDARGYIIPADQPDFLSATKFVDALLETGVQVHRATQGFTVNGKSYPAGSFVVKTAQAFRPHVIDMFEPQDHPDDIPYPGGPPTPPYDNAGWTLAYQMGVQFDRILDGFDGPFRQIEGLRAPRPAGGISGSGNAGWFLSPAVNDAFVAVNRLLAAGHEVYRLNAPVSAGGMTHPAGTFFISSRGDARAAVQRIGQETGLTFRAAGSRPGGQHTRLSPIRVALWDRYGGSMPSGWTRWIFEQFEVPFDVVYPQTLNEGDLSQYDAIVFVTGAIPAPRNGGQGGGFGGRDDDAADVPAEFRHMLGSITVDTTVPRLRSYLEQGGTIITIGSSTSLAQHLGLPVTNALTEIVDGRERPLPRSKYYIPGSVLQVRVDNTLPVAAGMPQHVDVMFDNSPVFRIDAGAPNVRPIAWFDSPNPLRSGWAWGESVLEGGVTMAEADVGRGRLFLFGPEVLFRAQPHGTFRFVFNGLFATSGEESRIR